LSDGSQEATEEGEIALESCLQRLDDVLNHSNMGTIPLPFLAQVSTFIIQTAATALSVMDTSETVGRLIGQCINAMQERDFVMAKIVGADLTRVLLFMLKKESQWPSTAYREAFWCAAAATAVGLAHQCSFLAAILYLDKALILGLDRTSISDFFGYVEMHASQMAIGPCLPIVGTTSIVPDYCSAHYSKLMTSAGVSQPIQFPLPEHTAPDEAMIQVIYFQKSKPVVIRQLAASWPALKKWR